MSEWHVRAVTIGKIGKHPNADRLEITHVDNYPVVIGAGSFQPGDVAVYIPVDSVLPQTPEFENVYKYTSKGRVKAAKLRGIFSMGILHKPDWTSALGEARSGDDWAALFGITKYEPPAEIVMGGDTLPDDGKLPKYTDIEGLRRYPDILEPDEFVAITEKLHGACARYGWIDGEFYVGSKNQRLDPEGGNAWSRAAREIGLAEKLKHFPNHIFFGELLGVQDLKYGHLAGELSLRFFDVFWMEQGCYLNYNDLVPTLDMCGLPMVPILTGGALSSIVDLYALAEGTSKLAPHVREGIVIKPLVERWHPEVGRVILKLAGEGYLTR